MKSGIATALFLVALLSGGASAPSAQNYQIKLSRDEKVGNEYHKMTVHTMINNAVVKVGDKVVNQRDENETVRLDAVVKMIAADKEGSITRKTLTIAEFIVKKGGAEPAVSLPKGTVVTVTKKDDEDLFEIAGKAVDPEIAEALSKVGGFGKSKVTDDEVLGTKDRKKVGDEWPINGELGAKDLATKGIEIAKGDITGTVKLEKVEKVGGIECMDLRLHMTAKNFSGPLPPGMAVQESSAECVGTLKVPVDTNAREVSRTTEMVMKVAAKGKPDPDGPEMTMALTSKMSTVDQFGPVPPATKPVEKQARSLTAGPSK
jgi:hypothetical protein